ncbi:MAG: winged helix-turn-helix domain-containing protein [Bacteroidaceae bacterium]|nr:winged helix-turn-helix domain-containing protein [Bacteroidaceae bacterium]
MDRTSINRNALLLRSIMGYNREWTYAELKAATRLPDRDLNAAIGWLAHEGSICFGCHRGENNVSLGMNLYIG